jgi:hypothetical protein
MRNANAKEVVSGKQVLVEGYSPKEAALSASQIPRLIAQIQDERTVVGVQQIGRLDNGVEFLLLKIFIPDSVNRDIRPEHPEFSFSAPHQADF